MSQAPSTPRPRATKNGKRRSLPATPNTGISPRNPRPVSDTASPAGRVIRAAVCIPFCIHLCLVQPRHSHPPSSTLAPLHHPSDRSTVHCSGIPPPPPYLSSHTHTHTHNTHMQRPRLPTTHIIAPLHRHMTCMQRATLTHLNVVAAKYGPLPSTHTHTHHTFL